MGKGLGISWEFTPHNGDPTRLLDHTIIYSNYAAQFVNSRL